MTKTPKAVKGFAVQVNGEIWPCWTHTDRKIVEMESIILKEKFKIIPVLITPIVRKKKS